MSTCIKSVTAAWLLLLVITTGAMADSPWPNVVRRHTDDRDWDLITALIQGQQYEDAVQLCSLQQTLHDPASDAAAKWAIWHSNVLSKQRMTNETFDEAAVVEAQKPVADLLTAVPDHQRRLFLEAQAIAVQQDAAQHDVVVAAISLSNSEKVDAAFARLLRATTAVSEFSERLSDAQSVLNVRDTDLAEKALSRDLQRLERESIIDVVSMALMQTNLFPPDSNDQSTAANKAERLAIDTLQKLPVNSRARVEIDRLRVESIFRGGAYERAETNLVALLREVGKPIPANIQAMMVNIDLALGRVSQAGRRIDAFYDSQPNAASIEMDLAKLDWLIRQGDAQISDWLDSIERRNGAYARRRAEAISLSKLDKKTASRMDPAIIAAQGKEWLRRENPVRAGELLSAAARIEPNPDRAIKRASEAAAAFSKAKRIKSAASIMADVAIKNATAQSAPAAHLQAALLHARTGAPDAINTVEPLLKQTNSTWPKSEAAAKARAWLLEIYKRQKRVLDAATVATDFLQHDDDPQKADDAIGQWTQLAINSTPETADQILLKFEAAFKPLQTKPAVRERYASGAVYLLETKSLHTLPTTLNGNSKSDTFAASLLAFRRESVQTLTSPPENHKAIARWRLMRDGDQNPAKRSKIAAILKIWGSESLQDEATILVWNGEIQQAVDRVAEAAKTANNAGQLWTKLAETLESAGTQASRTQAIKIWDRLANGLPKGSPSWHNAKLAAIDLLVQQGNNQEAARRAKYILLTGAPKDASLLQRYRSASKP